MASITADHTRPKMVVWHRTNRSTTRLEAVGRNESLFLLSSNAHVEHAVVPRKENISSQSSYSDFCFRECYFSSRFSDKCGKLFISAPTSLRANSNCLFVSMDDNHVSLFQAESSRVVGIEALVKTNCVFYFSIAFS